MRSDKGDRLLVANNLSDNVVLLDVASGRILKSFAVSTGDYVPAAYPYTVIANKTGTKAWVSSWNASAVTELDLEKKKVRRRIELWRPSDPVAPGTHPTAMLLNRIEDILYVAIANASTTETDGIAAVELKKKGLPLRIYRVSNDSAPGAASIARALSPDEKFLYAAVASLMKKVIFFNLACVGRQISVNLFPAEPLNRPSDQRRNVRMRIGMQSRLHRSLHVVRPTALAFGAGNEQVISCTGERAGIPLRGNETDGRGHAIRF